MRYGVHMTNANEITAARTEYKAIASAALRKHSKRGLTILSFNAHCGHAIDDSDGEIHGTPADYVAIAKLVAGFLDAGRMDPNGPPEWDPGYAAEMQMARVQARAAAADLSDRHGGPRDRGRADAWYDRAKNPHKFQEDTGSSDRVDLTDPAEIAAYCDGYDNEDGRKDWG